MKRSQDNIIIRDHRRRYGKRHGFFYKLFMTIFVLLLLSILGLVGMGFYLYPKVPDLNLDLFEYSQNAVIYDKNNEPYQNLQGEENRQMVEYEEIPDLVKNAFIAIEDKRFYQHHGIDIFGTGRAIAEVIRNGNLTGSGGSTITQQLIKQTHLSSERSLERKFDEWILATRLEDIYTKEQILTAYLNKINFHGAEGIQAAARQYFNKDVEELDLAQAAILAAVPNSPTYFDPYTYDENNNIIVNEAGQIVLNEHNKDRANRVLSLMLDQGYISDSVYKEAQGELETEPGLVFNNPNKIYSYFTDALYHDILEDLTQSMGTSEEEVVKFINTSGLRIYSTVDAGIQGAMESISQETDLYPDKSNEAYALLEEAGIDYNPEVGMVVVNNDNGSVVGMVGGRNNSTSLALNRATSRYQTGSSTKPITVYGPALQEETATLAKVYIDIPIDLAGWEPHNSDEDYHGPTTVRDAIINSVNTVAVQCFADLGTERSAEYATMLGLDIVDGDYNGSALALGGYTEGQTPEEMAGAYAALARGGDYIEPYLYTKVEDSEGNVILEHEPERVAVFSPEVCYLITDALKQAAAFGTANVEVAGTDVAGKTGTTDEFVNAWFCGYTPAYSMAVYYGYDTNIVEANGTEYDLKLGVAGGAEPGPAAMFERVMNEIESDSNVKTFTQPTSIVSADIDKTSGLLATTMTDLDPRGTQRFREMFVPGTVPTSNDRCHVATSFDTSTGYRSKPTCPKSSVRTLGLIDTSSLQLPSNVTAVDPTYQPDELSGILTVSPLCPDH